MAGKDLDIAAPRVPEHAMHPNDGTLLKEGAKLLFRNFEGKEGQYNREGDRNFCLLLEEDLARDMLEDGWNVKRLKPRDGAEIGDAYIQVSVGFKGRGGGPRMVMITSKGRTNLDEDTCVLLDWADILVADVIIRPYHWNVNGKTGVKAYLKSIFVTINEDYLELKYSDVPEVEIGGAKVLEIEGPSDENQKAGEAMPDEDGIYDVELVD